MIADKVSVKEGDKPKWTKKPNLPEVTQSWYTYQQKEAVKDFVNTMLHCSETTYDYDTIVSIPTEPYEFPNGYNNVSFFYLFWSSLKCFVFLWRENVWVF